MRLQLYLNSLLRAVVDSCDILFLLKAESIPALLTFSSPLHSNGHMRIVKLLLRAGAAVNSENLKGQVRGFAFNSCHSLHELISFKSAAVHYSSPSCSLLQTPVDLAFQLNFNEVGECVAAPRQTRVPTTRTSHWHVTPVHSAARRYIMSKIKEARGLP